MKELGLTGLTCIEEELADIALRCFDTAKRYKLDLGSAIRTKDLYNQSRSYRHGGKLA
jgi:hypothetical protein